MTTTLCELDCGQPSETRMCRTCLNKLFDQLREIEWIIPELDITITRQAKISNGGIGFVTGNTGSTIPVHLGASTVAATLRDRLARWIHTLWEDNGPRWHRCTLCGTEDRSGRGVDCRPGCTTEWETHLDPLDIALHPLPLSRWLIRHPTWISSYEHAAELFDDITGALRHAKRSVFGPANRVFLGICSAPIEVPVGDDGDSVLIECPHDLYGLQDRPAVVCPGCGAEWDAIARRRHMLTAMEDQLLTATELSRALPNYLDRPDDKPVTAAMIRGYAHRGRLLAHSTVDADPDVGNDEAVIEVAGRRREPRYRVGDLLDILEAQIVAEAS